MRLGEIIEFRNDLYFEGAVQADWFYDPAKAAKVAENFVFHGKNYFGVEAKKNSIDTISFVSEIAGKLGKETCNPRTLAIADYGTGKTHLAVTLGVLLSGPAFLPEAYDRIMTNIRALDSEAADKLSNLCKDRNFVIVLNGIRDFNLHSEILKAVGRSLKLYGLDDSELRKLNRTLESAQIFFDRNSRSYLHSFEKSALKRGWTEQSSALITKIQDSIGYDDSAFEIVNDVYEEVTGQRIRWDEGISAKSILEMLLTHYCGVNGQFDNVIVLFDEFGRYLEYASGTDGGRCGDNALQEMFEVSQNASGALQLINFIQADIKTYLLRVDQSRNLSRYIGRYDESEKYHLSSNLETVFANLISRKEPELFNSSIVLWQNSQEKTWRDIFDKVNRWSNATGIWADYDKYRKVVVEGIYPMHPISVYMLTQLSDYLQNRSSLNLVNRYISSVAEVNIDSQIPLILPTQLMRGDNDLFVEMLSAETSGRHRSDTCIRFENILKKQSQKLNEKQIDVLRANLIARTLKFNTRNYEEAKYSLKICSGLSDSEIEEALQVLVNEYAVMAFDEMGGCFDFTEDAKGAYDYKILKTRLLANREVNLRNLLGNSVILEKGGFTLTQDTDFHERFKISSNEWCFTQYVVLAEDLTEDLARRYVKEWEMAKSIVSPKGILVWVYINKDSDYRVVERLQSLASLFEKKPIVLMLLNDSANMLRNLLLEYDVLDHFDSKEKAAYSTIFQNDFERVSDNIETMFNSLKKDREEITSDGVNKWPGRLAPTLSRRFEEIYPEVVPFPFDALLTNSNKFVGNGSRYYCQILKTLLSNNVKMDIVRDFPSDVKNRINALFSEGGGSSWGCLTMDCIMKKPSHPKVRAIYDIVYKQIKDNGSYDLADFFDDFCEPPYGLSEESAAMLLAVIIVTIWNDVRVIHNNIKTTLAEWKNNIIEDKKLHLDAMRQTELIWVDSGSIDSKFRQMFDKITDNKDFDEEKQLYDELNEMIRYYGLPDSFRTDKQMADLKHTQFRNAFDNWQSRVDDVEQSIEKATERGDISKALTAIEKIGNVSVEDIFTKSGISVSSEYQGRLEDFIRECDVIIRSEFDSWLSKSVFCSSVDSMKNFSNFVDRTSHQLDLYGYRDLSAKLRSKGDKELSSKADIKSRQEFQGDCQKFISDCNFVSKTNYIENKELIKRAEDLDRRFKRHSGKLDSDVVKLYGDVHVLSEKLVQQKEEMERNMNSVYDIEIDTFESLGSALDLITKVLGYSITDADRADFKQIEATLSELKNDCNRILASADDRFVFEKLSIEIMDKYRGLEEEIDNDYCPVVEDVVSIAKHKMDDLDLQWRRAHATLGDKTRQTILSWKTQVEVLPGFVSDETKEEIRLLEKEADRLISDGRIEDVIYYFERLNSSEQKRCLDLLLKKHANI